MEGQFATAAARSRPRNVGAGVLGVVVAIATGAIAIAASGGLIDGLDRLQVQATTAYRRGEWASLMAAATWACLFATVSTWLLAHSLRLAIGLPRRPRPFARALRLTLAWIAALVVLARLFVWTAVGGHSLRFEQSAPLQALAMGLLVWGLFGADVPRLLRNASAALACRLPALARTPRPLDRLVEGMRARVRGIARRGPATLGEDASGRAVLFRRHVDDIEHTEQIDAVGFFLENEGARAWVEVTPGRTVFALGDDGASTLTEGTRLEVVGTVDASDAGHRAGPHHLREGRGKLYVLVDDPSLNRRLLAAAAVELLAASGLCLAGLAFLAYGAYAWWSIP